MIRLRKNQRFWDELNLQNKRQRPIDYTTQVHKILDNEQRLLFSYNERIFIHYGYCQLKWKKLIITKNILNIMPHLCNIAKDQVQILKLAINWNNQKSRRLLWSIINALIWKKAEKIYRILIDLLQRTNFKATFKLAHIRNFCEPKWHLFVKQVIILSILNSVYKLSRSELHMKSPKLLLNQDWTERIFSSLSFQNIVRFQYKHTEV